MTFYGKEAKRILKKAETINDSAEYKKKMDDCLKYFLLIEELRKI